MDRGSFWAQECWGESRREGGRVARVYARDWGPAAMGRGAGFWIWFFHGIGLVCMSMCVVKAGASRKVRAPSSLGGGPARHAPSPPRPAPLRKQALTATLYTGRSRPWPQWLGIGGGRRRQARPPPGPAPGPAGQRDAPLPRSPPPPVDAAGRRGREGGGGGGGLGPRWQAGAGGEEGGGGAAAGRCGARRLPHPAGRGPGLTCALSNAIEIVQPCFQSDSLHNM